MGPWSSSAGCGVRNKLVHALAARHVPGSTGAEADDMTAFRGIMATVVDGGVVGAEAASAAGPAPAMEGTVGAGVAIEQSLSNDVALLQLTPRHCIKWAGNSPDWHTCVGTRCRYKAVSCGLF
jgi:hypothetical protein